MFSVGVKLSFAAYGRPLHLSYLSSMTVCYLLYSQSLTLANSLLMLNNSSVCLSKTFAVVNNVVSSGVSRGVFWLPGNPPGRDFF